MTTLNLSSLLIASSLLTLAVAPLCPGQHVPVDARHTLGAESCRDCHTAIVEQWERSTHAMSFSSLTRSPAALKIAANIAMKPEAITTKASCVRCHFTQEKLAGAVQTTMAVSCESCHGAAERWIDVHNSKTLSRPERVKQSTALGMAHPHNIMAAVDPCFQCHVINDEQLVNKAGHPALSPGFELLSWYTGEVKHNFLVSKEGKAVKINSDKLQPMPATRQRMLFLTGKLLHLAHSLSAVGLSSDAPVDDQGKLVRLPDGQPVFAVQHARTIQQLGAELRQLQEKLALPEFAQVLAVLASLPMSTGHQNELSAASQEIRRLATEFSEQHDGSAFAAVDTIIRTNSPHPSSQPDATGQHSTQSVAKSALARP